MDDHRQNTTATRATATAMAALGMIAGALLGCALAIPLAERCLQKYLVLVAIQEEASILEARNLLQTLQHSPYPSCSDSEASYFRELVFRSEYLKDAGRIHGGKIECSATSGRSLRAVGEHKAGATQPDGIVAYSNLVPIRDESLKRAGMQLGSAYVVFGSHLPAAEGPIPIHLTVTTNDADYPTSSISSRGAGTSKSQADRTVLRQGDLLSATYCSPLLLNCVTASTTVAQARQGEIGAIAAFAVGGGIVGAWFGITISFLRRRSLTLEQKLRRALAQNKLEVAYQPIVNLATGKIVGAEALARWTDERGVSISPDRFIRAAEEHGFVGTITNFVVHRALNDFREVLLRIPDFRLNVNVAAADLADPKFLPMLDEAMNQTKIPPSSLVIEVTESSTANQDVAMESIRSLRRRGHSIYIDDFGTGYSSLSYLLYLSVDTIKIDKAFTRAIGTESVTVAILPQIMAMARSMNLGVVVEVIETEQQALYFSSGNQRLYGQGWLFGRPIAAAEFLKLMDVNVNPASFAETGKTHPSRQRALQSPGLA